MNLNRLITSIILGLTLIQGSAKAQSNQNAILTWGLTVELFTLPEELFSQIGQLFTKAKNKKLIEATKESEQLKTKECSPWNNSTGSCSCAAVCPESYSILETRSLREQTVQVSEYNPLTELIENREQLDPNISKENTFDFLNEDDDFSNVHPRTFGYCWGFSHLWRRTHTLAFFNPDAPKDDFKTIKNKLKKIFKQSNPQIFNGFKSLNELSSDKEVKELLLYRTVKEWRKHAVDVDGLAIFLKRKIKAKKLDKFVAELKVKLENKQNPVVYFTHISDAFAIHVIPVYRLQEDAPNKYKMCFYDNHGTVADHKDCGNHVVIDLNQNAIIYAPWAKYDKVQGVNNLRSIGFTPEDKLENVRFVKKLVPFCQKMTQCQ